MKITVKLSSNLKHMIESHRAGDDYARKFRRYIPLVLEARISEYLDLVIQLTFAFGMAFQLPVIMVILGMLGVVSSNFLKSKRRISIVIIFILAAIFTPPDVISQIALAIPLLLLYEISIILCKLVENKRF